MNQSRITITIRDEELPEDAAVLLHMGGFDDRSISQKTATVVKYHDYWIDQFDEAGRFAISVYALTELSEADILSKMPHPQFGRSTVGHICDAGFEMKPTTISPPPDHEIQALQRFHYSIMLPVVGRSVRLRHDAGVAFADAVGEVRPEVARLISLFQPMTRDDVT